MYDLDGGFKRVFGSDFLISPSGFAVDGNRLIIAELRARLTVLDADDRPVCYLGSNEEVCDVDGWPNNRDGGPGGRFARAYWSRGSSTARTAWPWTTRATFTSPSGSSADGLPSWSSADAAVRHYSR